MDLLLYSQVDGLTMEVRKLTRQHEGLESTVLHLTDRTDRLESIVGRVILPQRDEGGNASRQQAGVFQQTAADEGQPQRHSLSEGEGEIPTSLAGAQNEPDPWYDWLVTAEKHTKSSSHVTVRDLVVLDESQYGARNSSRGRTASTWKGTPALQLSRQGSDPTGVELPIRDDELALACSHGESNTMPSSSASVHRPVVAGLNRSGTSYYSSTHLSEDMAEYHGHRDHELP